MKSGAERFKEGYTDPEAVKRATEAQKKAAQKRMAPKSEVPAGEPEGEVDLTDDIKDLFEETEEGEGEKPEE